MAEFVNKIVFQLGLFNSVAIFLSSSPVKAVSLGVDCEELVMLQHSSSDVKACPNAITDLDLQDLHLSPDGPEVLCNVSSGSPHPVVTLELQLWIFEHLHGLSHPGVHAAQCLTGGQLVWSGMQKDLAQWVCTCVAHQQCKIHCHQHAPMQPIPVSSEALSYVHIDKMGPFPPSCGFTYLLSCIDWMTCSLWAIPHSFALLGYLAI